MGAEQSTEAPTTATSGGRVSAPRPRAQCAANATSLSWKSSEPTTSSPSPRVGAGGALGDSLIVVGGHGAGGEALADVWIHHITSGAWKQPEPAGRAPRARGGHTAVAVKNLGMVTFGGLSHDRGGYLSDVALLSGPSADALEWQPVCATGALPVGRDKHSAVAANGRMLIFGGFGIKPPEEEEDEDEEEEEDSGADSDTRWVQVRVQRVGVHARSLD